MPFPLTVNKEFEIKNLLSLIDYPYKLYGREDKVISNICNPDEGNDGSFSFCDSKNFEIANKLIDNTNSGIIVCRKKPKFIEDNHSYIETPDPRSLFIRALCFLFKDSKLRANLNKQVKDLKKENLNLIAKNRNRNFIAESSYISENVILGSNILIQNNCSIGCAGLGYHIDEITKERLFVPHLGSVIIGDNVVIGSNTVIVRGQFSDTFIGENTRLGNLVNIGHNVKIGSNVNISSSTAIAGGSEIGEESIMGINCCINSKIKIGRNSLIGMGSVVTKSFPDNSRIFGNPAKKIPFINNF